MKTLSRHLLLFVFVLGFFAISPVTAQTDEKAERNDYLIVVANSTNKAENEKVLSDLKEKYDEAGLFYDEDSRQYYVYIERYYSKSGADYAVFWLKKNRAGLPKVWAKKVPAGAK